jgi:DNA-3-methyladenine glycosylase
VGIRKAEGAATAARILEPPAPIPRRLLPADTIGLARFLLGCLLVRRQGRAVLIGRIVETEAYRPDDAASHAFRGRTPRNRAMYLHRGHAYVYFIYGSSFMLNVSSEAEGIGAGVLIRAVEPLAGLARMARNRGLEAPRPNALARGPGRLAQAFAIDRSLDGIDLCKRGPLWISRDPLLIRGAPPPVIALSPRIGIRKNAAPLWRFFIQDSPFVSRGRFLVPF